MNINQPVIQMYLDFEKMILNFLISIHLVCSDLKYSNQLLKIAISDFLNFSIFYTRYGNFRFYALDIIRYL